RSHSGSSPCSCLCAGHSRTGVDIPQEGIRTLAGDRGETIENIERPTAMSLCSLLDRHEAGHYRGPPMRAMPECDLPEDDQRTKASFGVIVRRRHAGIVQKDQPAILIASDSRLQRDRLVLAQRALLQAPEL